MLIWGKDTHALPAFTGSEPLYVFGATILPQHLWIFAITVLILIASKLFFNYSIAGKAMRACSFNRQAACLVGIDVRKMVLFSFMISSAVGSMAGIIIAPLTMTSYDVGIMLGIKGFCAAIIGGMGTGAGHYHRRSAARASRGVWRRPHFGELQGRHSVYHTAPYTVHQAPGNIRQRGDRPGMIPTVTAKQEILIFFIFALAVLLLPLLLQGSYFLNVLVFVGINTMLAVALNLLLGYAGQISLGHAAFFGLGAYISGVLHGRTMPGIPGL